jgi:hypothetical protein
MSNTLTITFTAASPAPANGYRVKYWPTSNPSNITTVSPNPTSSPVTISGLTQNSYSGTVEADCGGGNYSSISSFGANLGGSCLTGTTLATANCSSGQTSTFTLNSGYNATVTMTGYFYSGTGTRTITGALLDNSNAVIQNFTYTQTGSSQGTTSPANYTITTPGTYKLQVNMVNCSSFGSGTGSMTVGNCVASGPTYYYYTGLLCGGSIQNSFRSTINNLGNGGEIVRALCATCGNTEQCFDNISPTLTPNTNDIIGTYSSCSICNGGGSYNAISSYYNPCVLSSSNGLTANDVYFVSGVTDVATVVQLYTSSGAGITTVTMIADYNGNVYNVNSNGVVTTYTGNTC